MVFLLYWWHMKKPVIGISTNELYDNDERFAGSQRVYVNKDYLTCIEKAGGTGVLLPPFKEEIDRYDQALILSAAERDIPILGICRGMQMINVSFGGTLLQDINTEKDNAIEHMQKRDRQYPSHWITEEPGSLLAQAFDRRSLVNSFHHQAVDEMADGFLITAMSDDGIIEAMEKEEGSVYGVQFHPEMMGALGHDESLKLFREFVNLCRK
jgi:gamma-glutamyl-gamma-aminobutyrate hydrolase PuuD